MFTFKVANIRDNNFPFGLKKLVVFHVAGDKQVCLTADCLPNEKAAGTSANRHFSHFFTQKRAVANHLALELFFRKFQKIDF